MAPHHQAQVSFYESLPLSTRSELLKTGTKIEYKKKSYLFHKGDADKCFYIIDTGTVIISIKSINGHETILDTFTSGEAFGEVSAVDGGLRIADAIVEKGTVVIKIQRPAFLKFLKKSPETHQALVLLLCARLRWTAQFIEDLLYSDTTKRTLSKIVFLAEKQKSTLIEITQEQLAKMQGTSREVVNRNLQFLQDHGLIFIKRGAILITDIKKLKSIIGGGNHGG